MKRQSSYHPEQKTILHLVPIGAFATGKRVDVNELSQYSGQLRPICAASTDASTTGRYNLDGIVRYTHSLDEEPQGYVQVFRNGAVEAVDGWLLNDPSIGIPSERFEADLIKSTSAYLKVLRNLGIAPPIVIMLTLTGVKNYRMTAKGQPRRDTVIDRDLVLVPDLLIQEFDTPVVWLLKPAFDAIWNAAGWPRSRNYDENGNWVGRGSG